MPSSVLALNAGSSSLKFALYQDSEKLELMLRGQFDGLPVQPRFLARGGVGELLAERSWDPGVALRHEEAANFLFGWLREQLLTEQPPVAVGHRVVHGGDLFAEPVQIDARSLAGLETLVPLAPLHQPLNLAPIRAIAAAAPGLPQVACFDTAFHRTQPAAAQRFALPRRFHDQGVRRYGFHGLSFEHAAATLRTLDPLAAAGRTIVAHLGAGASLCAMKGGRSVATTMGFTALDGLVMATRCGNLDPGVLLHLMDRHGLNARAIEDLLYHRSGLLGVSEISGDMRVLLQSPDPQAREAVDLFVYRVGREIGSLAAALGGLDALVFTAGIGENSPAIRERIGRDAAWLGLEWDKTANERGASRLHLDGSRVSAWIVPADEERMIAIHTRRLLRTA